MAHLDMDHSPGGAKTGNAGSDTLAVLSSALLKARARQVIDLGCGEGVIAQALTEAGFQVTGVDPAAEAIERARRRVPGARFLCTGAEALPDDLPPFDAAFFVNALHHVPEPAMATALLGAVAAVRPGGIVVVIEPLAQGSFFRAMRPVEDETRIRAKAARTIETLLSRGQILLRDLRRWNRESRFAGLQDFVEHLSRVAPERAALAVRNEAALARAWRDNIRSSDGMAVLVQPMICWTLTGPEQKDPKGKSQLR